MDDSVEELDGYTITRKRYQPTDPRLGRHVNHDSRSLAYQVRAQNVDELKSVRHQRYIPVLDQGQLGSCTANAGTGNLGSSVYWVSGTSVLSPTDATADEVFAVDLYSDATKVDDYQGSYPPDDTGSDGLSIAKVLTSRGLISGYTHATSLEAALSALATAPAIVGIEWRQDMFNPDSEGRISITGAVAGGHEIVFDELDVENKRVWFTNSWGTSWGISGRAFLTWDDFDTLLKATGDLTQFVPIDQPAPIPDPTPVPDPKTVIQEIIDAAKAFATALENFIKQI